MTQALLRKYRAIAASCAALDEYLHSTAAREAASIYGADDLRELLSIIWDFREEIDFGSIRKLADVTQKDFCEQHGVPPRTLQRWCGKADHTPPEYILEYFLSDVLTEKFRGKL